MTERRPSTPGVEWQRPLYFANGVYLQALGGVELPPGEHRDTALALASDLGVVPPDGAAGHFPGASRVAEELRSPYPPSLMALHAAALRLDGYRTTGDRVASGTARGIGAVSGLLVEGPIELIEHIIPAKYPLVSSLVGGVSKVVSVPAWVVEQLAERPMNQLEGAAHSYINRRYGEQSYTALHQAPWIWGSLLGSLSRIRETPDAVLLRVALSFMDSYQRAARGVDDRMPERLYSAYRHLAQSEPALRKMIGALDQAAPLDDSAHNMQQLLVYTIRNAAKPQGKRQYIAFD